MPYVTSDMTTAMRTNVKALFMKGLTEMADQNNNWQKIATVIPSDSDKEEYNWLGATPPMEEWIDERKLRGLRPYSYTLTNQDWESTLEINRNAFEDNKLGHIPMRVKGLVRSYFRRVALDVFSKLDGGAADLATFDAGYFFKTDRTIADSGTINNLITGDYSESEDQVRAGLAAAVVLMMGYKDDWGNALGLMPDTVVCSPSMYILIKQAIHVPGVAGTTRAEAEFVKNIVVSPWIDGAVTTWYLLCTTEEVKPIIFQERKKPEVTSLDKPDDRDVFMRKTLFYGIDARFTVGYGDPRTAVQIVNS